MARDKVCLEWYSMVHIINLAESALLSAHRNVLTDANIKKAGIGITESCYFLVCIVSTVFKLQRCGAVRPRRPDANKIILLFKNGLLDLVCVWFAFV